MERSYDIFEKFADSGVRWRAVVPGLESAIARMTQLAGKSPNQFFVLDTPANAIVARANVPA